jgi:hypothetical protein
MRPQTSPISGTDLVTLGEVHSYSVTGGQGSTYCWTVTGGTIVADNGNSIDVLWDTLGEWSVEVVEVSSIEVAGNAQSMTVEVVQPTSIPEASMLTVIFPNPASDVLTVQWQGEGTATGVLRIIDGNGRTVLQRPVAQGQRQAVLDISTLSPGHYLLEMNGSSFPFVKAAP